MQFPSCNPRAAAVLVVSLLGACFPVLSALGAVHLTDETSGVNGQQFGEAISELSDQNSDGRHEFLVGAPGDDVNGLEAGAVFYYRSREDNRHGLQQVWRGVGGEKFGFAVARIGDVNGDDREDFAVGAPFSDAGGSESGRICIFFGGDSISGSPDVIIVGKNGGDHFGHAISAAGDFDGDGRDDLIVGAPFRNAPGAESGAAYIIFGAGGGPSNDLDDALELTGEIAGDHFGFSVTHAGNFLGAGSVSVAVGAPDNTADGLDAGAVYVYEGVVPPSSPDADFDLKIRNGAAARPGSRYGFAVEGIGRWDGDGYDDLAIGAPYCNESGAQAGRVEIVLGDTSPSASGDRYVNGEAASDHLGYSLAGLGDVEGSSLDDLLMGAPGHDGTASNAGRAYIYTGGSSSTGDAGNLLVLDVAPLNSGTGAGDQFGVAVASAGLFDDDDIPDYAVGALAGNIGSAATAGYCWVLDSGGGVVPNLLQRWEADWEAAGAVRLVFALAECPADLTHLELRRSLDGARDQVIWSGAVPGAAAVDGLARLGAGFTYLDTAAPSATGISYTLDLTFADGTTATLAALAGPAMGQIPGARPALAPLWPNPFNPTVTVRFLVPSGQEGSLRVLDLRGRQVAELFAGQGRGIEREVTWSGRDQAGLPVSSGVYHFRLETADGVLTRRAVLAK